MPAERVDLRELELGSTVSEVPPSAPPEANTGPKGDVPLPLRSYGTGQFAFVPVGLSPANLAWIESLIRHLRERGDRQASRSKIVRCLIERFGHQLEAELLGIGRDAASSDRHIPVSP